MNLTRFFRFLCVLPILILTVISSGYSQVGKGRYEIGIRSGSIHKNEGQEPGININDFVFGYFIKEKLEVGARLSLWFSKRYRGWAPATEIEPMLTWYFPESESDRIVPYVGGTVGASVGRWLKPVHLLEGFAGIKVFSSGGGSAVSVKASIFRHTATYYFLQVELSILE